MNREYTHALTLYFLTPLYDCVLKILGLGDAFYEQIISHIEPKDGDKILDVGTGTGNLAIAIKRKYPKTEVTGVDPDPKILKIARKKIKKSKIGIKIFKAAAQSLSFEDESFDFVVSSLVVHHIPRQVKKKAFLKMRRVLKENGTILIVDFGIPKNIFLYILVFILSLFEDVRPNMRGFIPHILKETGFRNIKEVENKFGIISFYKGKK
ncbi:MAG: 16S rRNA (cytosine(1402)-N(4))-methyltransferase [Candidatus Levybacteria bacterium RIFCSPLOWO2_01_FULL_38_13]|nr:MAG: 16S rRNA (cytosine(1402)-N(4))-methyltransferase [Candidatus Levybacteria bacterium RIFCSPHIGHO2_01_FULL_41_15]OGH35099.1 MAG: 16S rRNA (cytosine(1402)-N(4))-methyltransferase [Candidatus Levybacteria bacterium RIFCSPLOWO2_01_FULL_38_13]